MSVSKGSNLHFTISHILIAYELMDGALVTLTPRTFRYVLWHSPEIHASESNFIGSAQDINNCIWKLLISGPKWVDADCKEQESQLSVRIFRRYKPRETNSQSISAHIIRLLKLLASQQMIVCRLTSDHSPCMDLHSTQMKGQQIMTGVFLTRAWLSNDIL